MNRFIAMLAVAVALAAAPAQAAPESAAKHFDAGVALSRDGDYMAAMIEFKKAYELDPNYRVLYNMGQTARELREYASALSWFRQYLDEGGAAIGPERRQEVEGWIDELEGRVATVTIEVEVEGAEVAVDDIAAGTTPLEKPLVMSVGRRKISVTKPGHAPLTRYVDMAGGENKTLRFDLIALAPGDDVAPRPSAPRPQPPAASEGAGLSAAPFVLLGATVALGAAAGIVGGVALGKKADFEEALGTVPNAVENIDAARNDAKTLALAADVLTGFAVAAGIGTIIVFAVEASDDGQVEVGITPGGLLLRRAF